MAVKVSYDVSDTHYDVVIVGAGIAGAIAAKELSSQGKRVLILEAGIPKGLTFSGFLEFLDHFYAAEAKTPESPYPYNPNAPQPDVTDVVKLDEGKSRRAGYNQVLIDDELKVDTKGYFVQKGPKPFESTYTRSTGGSTLHWLGTCLRMLPEDFKMKSNFDKGLDWPLSYDDLMPYYAKAEEEIGVSAEVEEQQYLGIRFEDGYVFPMHKIPQSYLDQKFEEGLAGKTVTLAGKEYPLVVSSTPQGRNGEPNTRFNDGKGYNPVGAVGNPDLGQRCAGNTNCVPICPIQAKYSALKTLDKIVHQDNVDLVTQAVASKILVDEATGKVTGIEYKAYREPNSPEYTLHVAKGSAFLLAAHAIENAKLLLASKVANSSGLVGRHLMDHPVLLAWGLMPEEVGSFRGPLSTSGIENLRGGEFRNEFGAFRIEIGNEGWNWSEGDPYSIVGKLVDDEKLFGHELQERIRQTVPRQFRIGFLVEQMPDPKNRVTIDDQYLDALGNHRPIIQYDLTDYERDGLAHGRDVSKQIFTHLGVEDYTKYHETDPGYVVYKGHGYSYQGAGHLAGTHVMGANKQESVVDDRQRSWDHSNLYMTGCGNFPTMGTSNPTLTVAALAFMVAENILEDLKK